MSRATLVAAGVGLASMGGPWVATAAAEPEVPEDPAIESAVERALIFDSAVRSSKVEVEVDDGIASLRGTVGNLLARERAIRIAQRIRGVRSVVDRIQVETAERPDDELAEDIRQALLSDPATDAYEIFVSASDGEVTLSGTVDSWQESQLAQHVARSVRGVTGVRDELDIEYDADRPDAEIAADVRRGLESDIRVDAPGIEVAVADAEVTLDGQVGSLAEKTRAISNAWVAGVVNVNADGLQVQAWSDSSMERDQMPERSDEAIRRSVVDALLHDPRVLAFKPTVSVNRGTVTLSGSVDNLKARKAAERDARNTLGVTEVNNELKLDIADPVEDIQLADRVEDALRRSAMTDSADILTTARDGVVSLDGTVDSFLEKSEAEDVAQRTNGVLRVENRLKVSYPVLTFYDFEYDPFLDYDPYYYNEGASASLRSDRAIREEIHDELFWSPFVDAEDISVTVDHGVATLTGSVEDWSEFRAATENAREGGAIAVNNKLNLE